MTKEVNAVAACRQLGITLDALYRLIYAGRLSARKEGRKWCIPIEAIENRLKAKEEKRQG